MDHSTHAQSTESVRPVVFFESMQHRQDCIEVLDELQGMLCLNQWNNLVECYLMEGFVHPVDRSNGMSLVGIGGYD